MFPGYRVRIASAFLAGLFLACIACAADAADPKGFWLTEDRGGIIQIRPCGDALCGIIVGLTDWPATGIKVDVRGNPQCHYTLLAGLKPEDDGRWHGTVTNPEDGRTYSAEVWVPADGVLRLRGYIGLPLLGSTQLWPAYHGATRADCRFP